MNDADKGLMLLVGFYLCVFGLLGALFAVFMT